MKKALITLSILVSCKAQEGFNYPERFLEIDSPTFGIPDNMKTSEPEVAAIQAEFEEEAAKHDYPLPEKKIYSQFATLKNHILGQCRTYDEANVIVIDSTFWQTSSETDKRSLVFHELGHCLLGRTHRTLYYQGAGRSYDGGLIPDWSYSTHPNWPLSLMHRSLVREDKFTPEKDYYLRELFDEQLINEPATGSETFNCQFD